MFLQSVSVCPIIYVSDVVGNASREISRPVGGSFRSESSDSPEQSLLGEPSPTHFEVNSTVLTVVHLLDKLCYACIIFFHLAYIEVWGCLSTII